MSLEGNPHIFICFVNDGSVDGTHKTLRSLRLKFPKQINILSNSQNVGKAASVRNGINHCLKTQKFEHYAYLDADLATSLEECYSYISFLQNEKKFVFASRILKIGSVVERRFSRFLYGRFIATLISNILGIKVYDTQCGCKLFTKEIAEIAFEKPFISKWLFDVEIFGRLLSHYGKPKALELMDEIPVKKWVDKGGSKVKLSYFFRLWVDLYRIWRSCRSNLK